MNQYISNQKNITNPQIFKNIPREHSTFQPPKYFKQPDYIPLTNGFASLQLPSPYISNVPITQVFQSTKALQHMNCIIEPDENMGGLYIGDIISTVKPGVMESGKIQALLTCNFQEGHFQKTARTDLKLITKIIDAKDNLDYPIEMHFPASFQFIEINRKLKKNVLVNCHAGKSRSGTIVCAYLIKKNKWTAQRSLNYIRNKRDRVKPNNGFWQKLIKYQQQIMEQLELNSNNNVNKNYSNLQKSQENGKDKNNQAQKVIQKFKINEKFNNYKYNQVKSQAINVQNKKQDSQKLSLRNATKSMKAAENNLNNDKSTPSLNTFRQKNQKRNQNISYLSPNSQNKKINPYNFNINSPLNYSNNQSTSNNQNLSSYPIYNSSNYSNYKDNNLNNNIYQNLSLSSNNYTNSNNYIPYNQYNKNNYFPSNSGSFHHSPSKNNFYSQNLYYTPSVSKSINNFNLNSPLYSQQSSSTAQIKTLNQIDSKEQSDTRKKLFDKGEIKLGQKVKKKLNNDNKQLQVKNEKIQQK